MNHLVTNFLAAGMLVLALHPGWAAAKTKPAAEPPKTESQKQAAALLDGMAKFLGSQKHFQVEVVSGYEAVQATGQKIEFGERRTVGVERPNRLRIENRDSAGREELTLFDGKQILVFDGAANTYAAAAQKGNVDETIVHFVRDLGMRLPMAALLTSKLQKELDSRVLSVDYVEATDVLGANTHHIAGRTASTDFEFWIEDGKAPLPRKVAVTYRQEPGAPRFWAELSDWNLDPGFTDSIFEFTLPKDAHKVKFATELAAIAAAPGKAAAPVKGETK